MLNRMLIRSIIMLSTLSSVLATGPIYQPEQDNRMRPVLSGVFPPDINEFILGLVDDPKVVRTLGAVNRNLRAWAGKWKQERILKVNAVIDGETLLKLIKDRAAGSKLLRFLDLSSCTEEQLSKEGVDAGLIEVLKLCPALESLNLGNLLITDELLGRIAESCPTLLSINLGKKECRNPSYSNVMNGCELITNDGLQALANCPRLASLNLKNRFMVTDEGACFIAATLPHLALLNLDACTKLTDRGLRTITKSLKNLDSVNLSGCLKITDLGFLCIAGDCPDIVSLNLAYTNITDTGWSVIAGRCRKIRSLDLSCCRLTHESLLTIPATFTALASLKLGHSENLTDDVLLSLALNCKQLRVLDLVWCKGVTDAGLLAVAQGCPIFNSLRMSGGAIPFPEVTMNGLCDFAENCQNLASLHLSNLKGDWVKLESSVEGWSRLSQACQSITSLTVESRELTDEHLLAIVGRCPKLSSLRISGRNYTESGLLAVVKQCPNLTSLDVSFTVLSEEGLASLAAMHPHLTSITVVDCFKIRPWRTLDLVRLYQPRLNIDTGS